MTNTFTVRVFLGRSIVETIRGFNSRSAANARAIGESRNGRIAIVGETIN